ncbi:TlpA family protein disulfide reductase [Effusibacillus consociatus]|uniref:TlpA family protein disulfide reductase n=1 Tax=Effusibacillus consociatus TaxID=1117041 RepID=A0ABV9PWK2_9BACL
MSNLFLVSYGVLWLLVVSLFLLMFLVFRQFGLVYLKTAAGVSRSGVDLGTTIPDLEVKSVTGDNLKLSDYSGQPLLIVFTSPHCAPCRNLVSHLDDFIDKYPGISTLVFSIDGSEEETRSMFPRPRYSIIPLPDREIFKTVFEGEVTPFAFVIDDKRKVVAKGLVNSLRDLEHVVASSGKSSSFIQITSTAVES